ncbi:unnamed protein product, partial [Ectocarpus sp. 8 AP-2014]
PCRTFRRRWGGRGRGFASAWCASASSLAWLRCWRKTGSSRCSTSRQPWHDAEKDRSSSCACARPSKPSTSQSTPTNRLSTPRRAGQSWKRKKSGTDTRKKHLQRPPPPPPPLLRVPARVPPPARSMRRRWREGRWVDRQRQERRGSHPLSTVQCRGFRSSGSGSGRRRRRRRGGGRMWG